MAKNRKPNGYWTEEKCAEEAKKYIHRTAFKKGSGGAFNAASKGGFLDNVCSHMECGCKPRGYWTKERCLSIAAEHKTIGELEKNKPHILNKIRKNNWNLDPSYKMARLGNRHYRRLYAFEFEDGYVYVGLSYNPEKRRDEHLTREKSPVYKHLKISTAKFVIYPEFYHKDDVGKKEGELILKYQEDGWSLLNSATAGGLGSGRIVWTKEKIKEELDKFDTLQEFKKHYKGAYSLIYKNNWHDIIESKHRSQKPRGYWTKEKCLREAKKYNNRKEFRKCSSAAADFAKRNGWLDEICSHMDYINKPNGYWSKERCIMELKQISTIEQLNRNTKLRSVLYYHGWMDELTKHITRNKNPNGYWTKERCSEEARKYSTRKEFKIGQPAAYNKASRMKWLDKICTHMVSGRVKT